MAAAEEASRRTPLAEGFSEKSTVGELSRWCLDNIARHRVRVTTLATYERQLRLVTASLRNIPVRQLRPEQVATFVSKLIDIRAADDGVPVGRRPAQGSTMPINPFLPLIMFAILFGLSMDYEVFLLSRIREEYVATGDNHEAVVTGLSITARVITSAALIMISVFGAFVLGDDPNGKLFGVGLSVAVFLVATLVRMVLVPATVSLPGRANWWLPAWLDRMLPRLDLEGAPTRAGVIGIEPERELTAA
jgi:uncharacterized membrane protein YdfJ with MMPL/SSD domain